MRSKLLLALLGMATMFAGCSQEESATIPSGSRPASFTIAVDDGMGTRTVTEPTEKPTRYIMEVYEGTTAAGAVQATQVEQAGNTFDVILKDGQDYTILFWADYGVAKGTDNVFDASSLRAVKMASGKKADKAAFAGVAKFRTGTDNADEYTRVTLKHAVAQVNFMQSTVLTATTNTLAVTYTESYALNVEDGSGTKTVGDVTHSFAYNQTEAGTMGTDYILVPADEKILMPIKAQLNTEAIKEIPNVPFQGNFRTNISGSYTDKYSATLTATCDGEWGTPDNEENLEPVILSFKVGDYYPIGATKTAAVGVVFWVDDTDPSYNATAKTSSKGKIVSMDEGTTTLSWTFAQNWRSAKELPAGMAWSIPTPNELQYLWCAYNGKAPITWPSGTNVNAPADTEKQAGFNAKLDMPFTSGDYWTNQYDSTMPCYVSFSDGGMSFGSGSSMAKPRNIASF